MRCAAEREVGGIVVLELASRAALGDMTTEVSDRVRHLLTEGRRKIVLNLGGVKWLDSHSLGELVGSAREAVAEEATLRLCQVAPDVMVLLRTMNVAALFHVTEREQDAVQSFE